MEDCKPPLRKIISTGFDKVCIDFDKIVAPHAFKRVRKRIWERLALDRMDVIHFDRHGSSWAATNSSVSFRIYFATRKPSEALTLHGPCTDQLRDSRGYAYHLRFNAWTWSTYDRCVVDMERVLLEQGLPWFAQRAEQCIQSEAALRPD